MGALREGLHPSLLKRKIIHVDMDCFFAAVEELDNPSLKGKPVAVGGSPQGRGVLCTANYEARKYGVRSAMSSSEALRRCPNLIFIRPRSARYKEIAMEIREIFRSFTSLVEPLSLDEAYLDVSDCESYSGSATLIAKEIRRLIKERTGLTASAGVAPNKFLAKVASDWKKPDGLTIISPNEALSFAQNLALEKVPGIGKVSLEKYHQLGLKTLKDIEKYPINWLEAHFGRFATRLVNLSQGIDDRKVGTKGFRKSIGCEETYHEDLKSFEEIQDRIPFLVEELLERTKSFYEKERPRSLEGELSLPGLHKIFVKAKTFDFNLHTYECPLRILEIPIVDKNDLNTNYERIYKSIEEMFESLFNRINQAPLRLLGVGFRISPSPHFELEKLGQLRLL